MSTSLVERKTAAIAPKEEILQESESLARDALKECKSFLIYQGQDPLRYNRARLAASLLTAYTRLRATIANEDSNRLVAEKLSRAR